VTMHVLIAMLVIIFLPAAHAWGTPGHLVIGQEAKNLLDDATAQLLNQLLQSDTTVLPNYSTIVPAATWPDELRNQGMNALSPWHYVNGPLCPTNQSLCPTCPDPANVVWALLQANSTLSFTPQAVFPQGFMIRFLLHLIGDIHQPLHCSTLYSAQFPTGDEGGNLFKVQLGTEMTDLHTFWDEAGAVWPDVMDVPLSPTNQAFVEAQAERLLASHPLNASLNFDPAAWAAESQALAVTYAYANLTPGETLSATYVANARAISEQRIALAGRRLAAAITMLAPYFVSLPPTESPGDGDKGMFYIGVGLAVFGTVGIVASVASFFLRRRKLRGRNQNVQDPRRDYGPM